MADELTLGAENVMLRTDTNGAAVLFVLDTSEIPPEPPVSTRTSLQVYPNPFKSRTSLRFASAVSGHAQVEILDVKGRLVRTVHRGYLEAGTTTWAWDGTDDSGRAMPAGVYFVKAYGSEVLGPRKIVRLN